MRELHYLDQRYFLLRVCSLGPRVAIAGKIPPRSEGQKCGENSEENIYPEIFGDHSAFGAGPEPIQLKKPIENTVYSRSQCQFQSNQEQRAADRKESTW